MVEPFRRPSAIGIDLAHGDSWTAFRCVCGYSCSTAAEMLEHVRRAHSSEARITVEGETVNVEALGGDAFDDPRD